MSKKQKQPDQLIFEPTPEQKIRFDEKEAKHRQYVSDSRVDSVKPVIKETPEEIFNLAEDKPINDMTSEELDVIMESNWQKQLKENIINESLEEYE